MKPLNKDWKEVDRKLHQTFVINLVGHTDINDQLYTDILELILSLLQEQKKSIIKKVEKLKLPETGRGTTYGDGYNHGITDVLDLLNQNK